MTTPTTQSPRTCLIRALGATVMTALGFGPVYAIAVSMLSGFTL